MFEYFTENAYWTIFNLLAKISLANVCWVLTYYFEYWAVYVKGQLISKCPSGVIVWTKLATKNLTTSALVVKSKNKYTLSH